MDNYIVRHHPTGRVAKACGRILTWANWRDALRVAEDWTLADAPLDLNGYWYADATTRREREALAVSLDRSLEVR
jgi:hypothetical protein